MLFRESTDFFFFRYELYRQPNLLQKEQEHFSVRKEMLAVYMSQSWQAPSLQICIQLTWPQLLFSHSYYKEQKVRTEKVDNLLGFQKGKQRQVNMKQKGRCDGRS